MFGSYKRGLVGDRAIGLAGDVAAEWRGQRRQSDPEWSDRQWPKSNGGPESTLAGCDPEPLRPGEPARVLVVGDDKGDLSLVKLRLRPFQGRPFLLDVALRPEEASAVGASVCPHVMLVSGWPSAYPDGGIRDVLPRLTSALPYAKTIAITSGASSEAHYAMSAGAHQTLERRDLGSSWLLPRMVLTLAEGRDPDAAR